MIYLIMGVSGSGKSSIGLKLAEALKLPFYDGDDFHPAANIDKMSRGIPLDDGDREPWLHVLATKMVEWNDAGGAVLACSALKEQYRETLRGKAGDDVILVYLDGSYELIAGRLQQRSGHFMDPTLLKSQFDALEVPEDAIVVSIAGSQDQIVSDILKNISL